MAVPKWGKRVGIGCGVLALLIILFYVEEDWRGAREWERVKKELSDRGEPLTLEEVLPHPMPDEQNIGAAPVFSPLFVDNPPSGQWSELVTVFRKGLAQAALGGMRSNRPPDMKAWEKALTGSNGVRPPALAVLEVLQKQDSFLADVKEALDRPSVRWPLTSPKNPMEEKRPYLSALINLVKFLELKAVAQVEAGQGDSALDTIQMSFRAAWAAGQGDVLINHLVEDSMDQITLVPVIVGLQNRVWNEDQLTRLQGLLAEERILTRFQTAMRGERAFGLQMISMTGYGQLRTAKGLKFSVPEMEAMTIWMLRPSGWDNMDKARYALKIQQVYIDAVNGEKGVFDSKPAKEIQARQTAISQASGPYRLWRIIYDFSGLLISFPGASAQPAVLCQAYLNEAQISCALERYRIRNGGLPDATAMLVPDFLPSLPVDPVTGQPLHYVRQGEEDYLLYSVGWDEKDDGGIVDVLKKEGDWTWASRPDLLKFLPGRAPVGP